MKIPVYNFELYQGNDEIFILKFDEVDNEGKSKSADLSYCQFALTVKSDVLSTAIFELSTENELIASGVIDSSGNFEPSDSKPYALKLHFPHEFTEKLYAPKYMYDLFSIHDDGIREVLLKGDVRITRSIAYGTTNARHY